MARYAPGKFIKKEYVEDKKYQDLLHTTQPLVGIVRTSLLKRMESSIKAFDASVKNYVTGYRLFRKQLDKGIIPIENLEKILEKRGKIYRYPVDHKTYNKLKGLANYKRTSEWEDVKEFIWMVDLRK